MCPRPYTFMAAQEMFGLIYTSTQINSKYILAICNVSQGS